MPSTYVQRFWVDRKFYAQTNVMLLGSFKEKERTILDNLKVVLSDFNLEGITLEDIHRTEGETPRQALHHLLAGCNFVIADDTIAGGEIGELEYCRNCGVITAIISRKGKRSSFMTLDHHIHSPDFRIFPYHRSCRNFKELEKLLKRIQKWVTQRKEQRKKEFGKAKNKWEKQLKKPDS